MSDKLNDESWARWRAQLAASDKLLRDDVAAACPGPHDPVQRRDRKPPWCSRCGRTADGMRIR